MSSPHTSASEFPYSRLDSESTVALIAPTLTPAPHPIGIFSEHTQHTSALTLTFRKRATAINGEEIRVEDTGTSGTLAFHIVEKGLGWTVRKDVSDSRGQPLFTLIRPLFQVRRVFEVRTPLTDELLLTLRSPPAVGTRVMVTYNNPTTGNEETLRLRADWLNRRADITLGAEEGGPTIARIARRFLNTGDVFRGKQVYELSIASNVDAAFIIALCLCFDARANEG